MKCTVHTHRTPSLLRLCWAVPQLKDLHTKDCFTEVKVRLYTHPDQIPANSTLTLPSANCPHSAPNLNVIKGPMEGDTVHPEKTEKSFDFKGVFDIFLLTVTYSIDA